MPLRFSPLTGPDLIAWLDDVARLRIDVFREWPYLYDGDLGYERGYLAAYRDSAEAIVVGARLSYPHCHPGKQNLAQTPPRKHDMWWQYGY